MQILPATKEGIQKSEKMKHLGIITAIFALGFSTSILAQENEKKNATDDKLSYYEQRAREDAVYEQSLTMQNEGDEEDFWKDQKRYEKDLKHRDKEAYKAYMKGKQDAYAEHEAHCDHHCHHSEHYHHQATFYYSYHRYDYPSRRAAIGTGVRVSAPSVKLGIF